ncbi:MAG: cytochrome c [Xanthobacteraceae bacterium]|nr:MAG: cytochrome c [Xanthobacteraceae bacterium]
MQALPTRWRTSSRWWLSAAAAVALAGSAWAGENAVDAAKLTALVLQDCGSCHGMTLKGGLGKPLTAEQLEHWDSEQIAHIILEGVPGTPMPPWKPLLSEAEARWIADHLKKGTLR